MAIPATASQSMASSTSTRSWRASRQNFRAMSMTVDFISASRSRNEDNREQMCAPKNGYFSGYPSWSSKSYWTSNCLSKRMCVPDQFGSCLAELSPDASRRATPSCHRGRARRHLQRAMRIAIEDAHCERVRRSRDQSSPALGDWFFNSYFPSPFAGSARSRSRAAARGDRT